MVHTLRTRQMRAHMALRKMAYAQIASGMPNKLWKMRAHSHHPPKFYHHNTQHHGYRECHASASFSSVSSNRNNIPKNNTR